jgi:hypothetical protein
MNERDHPKNVMKKCILPKLGTAGLFSWATDWAKDGCLSNFVTIPLYMLISTSSVLAQTTWVGASGDLRQKLNKKAHSYVLTSDNVNLWDGATPYGGANYPATLNTFPGPIVDVLMQQCFGGGFADGMNASITSYTFTSASTWNELAWNTTVGPDNFTRAWNDSYPRSEGLYQHYFDAIKGAAAAPPNGAVVQDPFALGGPNRTAKIFENPTFASPDALVGGYPDTNGVNNSRDILGNQWALLYAPQVRDALGNIAPRFGQNIDRIYNSLRTVGSGVPANHIIVLFENNAANTATPGGTPINGPATLANFMNASKNGTGLYGNITGQNNPGNPDANAHLFVFNTGHGESWTKPGGTVIVNPGNTMINVTQKPANGFIDADGSTGNTGNISLEFAFPAHVDTTGVTIKYNGVVLTNSITDEVLSPMTDLHSMIGTAYYWAVSIPLDQVNSFVGLPDDIRILGLSSGSPLVEAVTYNDNGDAWSVAVVVPPVLSISLSGGQVRISWSGGGTLQYSNDLNGPWFDIDGATSPFYAPSTSLHLYYRVSAL